MELTRLYRPQPPEFFSDGVVAQLDVDTNVVNYNREILSLTTSRDFGLLNRLGKAEPVLVTN